jgi:hypothetical protein
MKKMFIAVWPLLFMANAQAQSSLTDQINAVHEVELRQQAADQAAAAAWQAEREAERNKRDQARAAYFADQKARADARAAQALADKKRDQNYEDQQREVALEEQKLKLQMLKAKADRANEYVDQDLHREAAQTDVIQSQADASRNLSEGGKSLLQSTGEAEVKDASGWFK